VRHPSPPRKQRVGARGTRQGLTVAEQDVLLARQGGACALCGTLDWGANGPSVDHDHLLAARHGHPPGQSCRREVRGILCHNCNTGLGYFRDSPELLRRAATYVELARGAVVAASPAGSAGPSTGSGE